MAHSDFRSGARPRRPVALAGLRQNERRRDAEDRHDDRWPPWLSILFIAVSSLALWALLIWSMWWLIAG